jgi:hypothetical protein
MTPKLEDSSLGLNRSILLARLERAQIKLPSAQVEMMLRKDPSQWPKKLLKQMEEIHGELMDNFRHAKSSYQAPTHSEKFPPTYKVDW